MRILFTGSSSFTGLWFIRELVAQGHEVVAAFQRGRDAYDGVRGRRTELAAKLARAEFDCAFGSERFLALAASGVDVLCHHAAVVRDYKSPDFDFAAALAANTFNLRAVLRTLAAHGCRTVVATGSVFEPDEGAGEEPRRAFSPYGLSKGMTWQALRYFAGAAGLRPCKFVIANPFGPYEEPRFTGYLIKTWAAGATATVSTPAYVRDNIPVSLLAKVYARFAARAGDGAGAGGARLGPSGYVETQGAFAERVAREMRPRLELACALEHAHQTAFEEPRVRVNTDVIDAAALGWNEAAAWDELAAWYRARLEGKEP